MSSAVGTSSVTIAIPFGYAAIGLIEPPTALVFVSAIILTMAGIVIVPDTRAILTSLDERISVNSETMSCLHLPNSSKITSPLWF